MIIIDHEAFASPNSSLRPSTALNQLSTHKTVVMNRSKTIFIAFAALLFFGSCAKQNYDVLFYPDWELLEGSGYYFEGEHYSLKIDYEQLRVLPDAVKCYLVQSNLLDAERMTEVFYDYSGRIKTENRKLNLNKKYKVKDHASGFGPRYDALGTTIPLRFSSELKSQAKVEAHILRRDLLENNEPDSDALKDISTLKYLAQMVWYPTSFANPNVQWTTNNRNGKPDPSSAHVSVGYKGFFASGNMHFDTLSCMPIKFVGSITPDMKDMMQVQQFEATYTDFKKYGELKLPHVCQLMATTESGELYSLSMELKRHKPVGYTQITDKQFIESHRGKPFRENRRGKFGQWLRRLFGK
jgi:hypothetical protein